MKKEAEIGWWKWMCYFLILLFPLTKVVHAASLDTTISDEEKSQFDVILTPIVKIYNFIKYTASLVAVIALLFAGMSYMFSGNDVKKRETSKNMAAYVIVGLSVIWAAPYVVNVLIG